MNRGIFAPQSNELLLEFPQGNTTTDGRVQSGVSIGRFNQINGYSRAYILGSNNNIETTFLNGVNAAARPAAFIVGDGHQLGPFNYSFTIPSSQVLISPGVSYNFGANTYGNVIIDAGSNAATTTLGQAKGRTFNASGCVFIIAGTTTPAATNVGNSATVINSPAILTYGAGSVSIGGSAASGQSAIAIGSSGSTAGTFATGVGFGANAAGASSGAFGTSVYSPAARSFGVGSYSSTESAGEFSFGHGGFVNNLDAKGMQIISHANTTDATPLELKVAGSESYALNPTGVITLSNNAIYQFDCEIIGANATDTAGWNLKFIFKRGANAAASSLVGTVTTTTIGVSSGASAWAVSAAVDTTNGRPFITVTGAAATTIRWVGNYRVTKVGL